MMQAVVVPGGEEERERERERENIKSEESLKKLRTELVVLRQTFSNVSAIVYLPVKLV